MFYRLIRPTQETRVLDIGAEINPDGTGGLQLIDSYPWEKNITAVNLSHEHVLKIKKYYPEVNAHLGDACNLPWPDKHFDVVYSNAVIEHVGGFDNQKKMAAEVMRVGKRWFVATPNRWYPFEFHLRLPFVTWLPGHCYLKIGGLIRYNHVRRKYVFAAKPHGIRLMTAKELEQCFPDSRIIKQRVTFMAETLITIGGDIYRKENRKS